ncbi:hypothetical protein [Desulfosediminicola flagellatus]|uniref:hypothetical protein n=1 Tax=Desulfosediminicola flagellatus TaxID=2569541 RepID=UPI0010AB735F|nr:hypothetical protein [Desulfosediminicola flagellatus]
MNARISPPIWNDVERRKPNSCRRKTPDRRNSVERREDPRNGRTKKRTFTAWIRSITKGRIGVDRRKGLEQRIYERRNNGFRSLLTQEEIDALLS